MSFTVPTLDEDGKVLYPANTDLLRRIAGSELSTTTPHFVGQIALNTTTGKLYRATGTSAGDFEPYESIRVIGSLSESPLYEGEIVRSGSEYYLSRAADEADWWKLGSSSISTPRVFHVSQNGSDMGLADGSLENPFLTVQKAFEVAVATGQRSCISLGAGFFGNIASEVAWPSFVSIAGLGENVSIVGNVGFSGVTDPIVIASDGNVKFGSITAIGATGDSGEEGETGTMGGSPGENGGPGQPGQNGPNLTAYNLIADSIISQGGTGGTGGGGGKGGSGLDDTASGNGGDGGNGGNGGGGGDVTLIRCRVTVQAGSVAGNGGNGGNGGPPGDDGGGGEGNPGAIGDAGSEGGFGVVKLIRCDIAYAYADTLIQSGSSLGGSFHNSIVDKGGNFEYEAF